MSGSNEPQPIDSLDAVLRFERHVQRLVRLTGMTPERAESVLSAVNGPRVYRSHLRQHFARGGTWAELDEERRG